MAQRADTTREEVHPNDVAHIAAMATIPHELQHDFIADDVGRALHALQCAGALMLWNSPEAVQREWLECVCVAGDVDGILEWVRRRKAQTLALSA